MRHGKSSLAAVVVLAGLASSASAQGFGIVGGNGFAGGLGVGGIGFNQAYTGYASGYNGFYPGYTGFYPGYYPNYGTNYTPYPIQQTQNNMFGLMNSIRTQTGGGNSYRYGYGPAVGGRRR